MKTNHPRYEEIYDEVIVQRQKEKNMLAIPITVMNEEVSVAEKEKLLTEDF
jgi:hypothetical protein